MSFQKIESTVSSAHALPQPFPVLIWTEKLSHLILNRESLNRLCFFVHVSPEACTSKLKVFFVYTRRTQIKRTRKGRLLAFHKHQKANLIEKKRKIQFRWGQQSMELHKRRKQRKKLRTRKNFIYWIERKKEEKKLVFTQSLRSIILTPGGLLSCTSLWELGCLFH